VWGLGSVELFLIGWRRIWMQACSQMQERDRIKRTKWCLSCVTRERSAEDQVM